MKTPDKKEERWIKPLPERVIKKMQSMPVPI